MATLRNLPTTPPTPYPPNLNPQNLRVGDKVITDFYPGQERMIRTIYEILPFPKAASGLGVRFRDKRQWFVCGHAVLVAAERCLPLDHPHASK